MRTGRIVLIIALIAAWMFRYENYEEPDYSVKAWHRNRFTNAVCPIDQDCFWYTFPYNDKPWHCVGSLTKWCRYHYGTPEQQQELMQQGYHTSE